MAIKVKLEKDGFIKDGFVGYSYTSAILNFWVPAFRLDFNAFVFFFGVYMLEKFLSEFFKIYSMLNYYSIENDDYSAAILKDYSYLPYSKEELDDNVKMERYREISTLARKEERKKIYIFVGIWAIFIIIFFFSNLF